MFICYLDESGTHKEARYFVLAGLAVFERETYYLKRNLDQIQAKYFPTINEPIPFHASPLKAPENRVPAPYNTLTGEQRKNLVADAYRVISDSNAHLFAVAAEKIYMQNINAQPYEFCFEQIMNRFDRMLGRLSRDRGEDHRGLLVIAESSYHENIELLAHKITTEGHRWGQIHGLADIPYFAPAKSTRLLQLADFVAHAVFARYESGYIKDLDTISGKFDQDQGRLHGMVHNAQDRTNCYCLACANRRAYPRIEIDDPH